MGQILINSRMCAIAERPICQDTGIVTAFVNIAAKGGGSKNKTKFAMLNPDDSIVEWVSRMIPKMGADWCPPGVLGIGIGGTVDKTMVLAKEVLMDLIDIHEIEERGPANHINKLQLNIYNTVRIYLDKLSKKEISNC